MISGTCDPGATGLLRAIEVPEAAKRNRTSVNGSNDMANESWQVDGAHSAVNLTVRHMVISKVRGRFTKWNAKLALDTADLARSAVEVEIEAASIDTGVGDRDTHLR